MRGHEAIIDLRRKGRKPSAVWIDLDGDRVPAGLRISHDWQRWGAVACVDIADSDAIGRLDLRWAVGLLVMAAGFNAERVRALHAALVAAGSRMVMSAIVGWRGGEVETLDSLQHGVRCDG